jgi:RNA polymerase sigma factor (TIGR02999 family)
MSTAGQAQITRILADLREGDPEAVKRLLPVVYEELRRLAHKKMKHEPRGLTLQATALVHEAYLRLLGDQGASKASWENRRHFFAAAAEAMRRILVERARKYGRQKHGGGRQRVPLGGVDVPDAGEPDEDLLALDEALRKLEAEDPARSEVVRMRYFAGLTIEQTAETLGLSPATVKRHWTYAQAWLSLQIRGDGGEETG